MRRSNRGLLSPAPLNPEPLALPSRPRSSDRDVNQSSTSSFAADAAAAASPAKKTRLIVILPPSLYTCLVRMSTYSLLTSPCQLHVSKSPPPPSPPPPATAQVKTAVITSSAASDTAAAVVAVPAPSALASSAPHTPRLTKSLSFADQKTENDPSPTLSSPRYSSIRRVSSGGGMSSPRARTVESFSQAIAAVADVVVLEATATPRSNRRSSSALSVCTSSGGTEDGTPKPNTMQHYLTSFASSHQMPLAPLVPTAHPVAPCPCH
jgi:hypothetical protein